MYNAECDSLNMFLSPFGCQYDSISSMKYLLFVGLLLFYLHPLLTPGLLITHDGDVLVARIAAYSKAFTDWHIPPRWAGDLNYGYGAPVFIFFYPLLGYLGALFHGIGFSYMHAYTLLAAVSFIGCGASFFLWLRSRIDAKGAAIGAIFYALSPYHFLNLYVRGDIGELMALAIAPLVLWAIEKSAVILGSIVYALLILSHHGIAFLLTPAFVVYAFVQKRSILPFVLGLGLSSYFWLAALGERGYTAAERLFGSFYQNHFLDGATLIWSPWGFGDRVRAIGGLAPQIGPVHTLVFIFAVCVLWKVRALRKELFFWLGVLCVSLFFLLPISVVVWEHVSLLRSMGFPWRFIGVVHIAIAAVIGIALTTKPMQKFMYLFFLLLFLMSIPLIDAVGSIVKDDSYWEAYPGSTSFHGEATTVWTAGDPFAYPQKPIEIIDGAATVSAIERKTQRHEFVVAAKTSAKIVDNTTYFPGWQVFVNGKKTPIEFQDPNYRGLITFSVPAGISSVEVKFTESPVRLLSDIISLATLFGIIIWIVVKAFTRGPLAKT